MRKARIVAIVASSLVVSGVLAGPARTDAAAPYVLEPGVRESYRGGVITLRARIFCDKWKAIVELTAGINGQRYVTRTIYACATTERANVKFTIRPSQLGPNGNYQYRLKVGRHDSNGNVTRWTHSVYGKFRLSY